MPTVAYRRFSGKIGLTDAEVGTRGLWWEKRRALWKTLKDRGNEVRWFSQMTKPSKEFQVWHKESVKYADVLIVEFGGTNTQFYGDDIRETLELCRGFSGPKVFLSDDPDLGFPWRECGSLSNWRAWYNCLLPRKFPKHLATIPAWDFPFSALQEFHEPVDFYQGTRLAYVGRPTGREEVFRGLIAHGAPFRAFGREKEWEELGVTVQEAPDQPQRAEFYRLQVGALAVADQKHKEIGFRTGRAYHALMAGCPVAAEADHPALTWARRFRDPRELKNIVSEWRDPWIRRAAWWAQAEAVNGAETAMVDAALTDLGL